MYVSAQLLAINCLEAGSFTARGMRVLLQKLHIHLHKTFAKDLYKYFMFVLGVSFCVTL